MTVRRLAMPDTAMSMDENILSKHPEGKQGVGISRRGFETATERMADAGPPRYRLVAR